MHILGTLLPENQLARHALTHFYGIGQYTAHRLCARMQIHDRCRIRDLTPYQITSLTAYLSSPTSSQPAPALPLAVPGFRAPRFGKPLQPVAPKARPALAEPKDPLLSLKIETDLKREIRDNIAHQRTINSYVGRRHAMGLPVRGQNTQTNAKTAKKLNRIERYF